MAHVLAKRLRRLARIQHDRGTAIIEFAIIAPVLVIVMCGLGDIALSIFARMLATSAAQAMADLATQPSRLRGSDVADIYTAAATLMRPLSSSALTLRVTNIASDGNNRAFVYWSCGQGTLPAYVARSTVTTTPTGSPVSNFLYLSKSTSGGYTYDGTNTSFIMVEASYPFTPPTQVVLKTVQVTYAVAYALPRLSTYVGFPWDGVATNYPPLPTATTQSGVQTQTASGTTISCNYGY